MEIVCFTLVVILLVVWLLGRKRHLSFFKKLGIPGPEPNLLFGNIIELYRKGAIQCHREWVQKYGRVLGYYYGMKPILFVADPVLLKNIFIKDFPKFINRELFNPLLQYDPHNVYQQSIAFLEGQKWKDVRSVLTPSFTAAKIKQMAGSMNASIDEALALIEQKAKEEKGGVVEIWDLYKRLSLDIITKTAFGVNSDVLSNPGSQMMRTANTLFWVGYRNALVFVGLCLPVIKRLCLDVHELFLGLVNGGRTPHLALRKDLKAILDQRRQNPQGTTASVCDFLQLMIDSKIPTDVKEVDVMSLEVGNAKHETKKEDASRPFRRMTDIEILSSSHIVFLGGFETTATSLAFTTYLLAKHQDAQQKVYEEIQSLLQDGQPFDCSTVCKLQYLDDVINESLRIYPPGVFFTSRLAVEDVQYGDLKIPKGTVINASSYQLHHDPEFWEDPEKFDPERFRDNDKKKANNLSYLPFGVGPRNCLGLRLAQMELRLVLAQMVNKFKITLEDDQEDLEIQLKLRTIAPKKGVYVKMELRQGG